MPETSQHIDEPDPANTVMKGIVQQDLALSLRAWAPSRHGADETTAVVIGMQQTHAATDHRGRHVDRVGAKERNKVII